MDKVVFRASFPAIQSAIYVSGDNNGMRIKLEIPESDFADAIQLLAWRERVLRVTVEVEDRAIEYAGNLK